MPPFVRKALDATESDAHASRGGGGNGGPAAPEGSLSARTLEMLGCMLL